VFERDLDQKVRAELTRPLFDAPERFLLVTHVPGHLDLGDDIVLPTADQIAAPHGHSREVGGLVPVAMLEVNADDSLGADLSGAQLQFAERMLETRYVLMDVDKAENFGLASEIVARENPDGTRCVGKRGIPYATFVARPARPMTELARACVLLAGVMGRHAPTRNMPTKSSTRYL
jgi:hypothetical protein